MNDFPWTINFER